MPGSLLPVHGFVLAGGRSSRMGRDKATLPFQGRPMVEIAVEKLRTFCAATSIAGNRDDLGGFAPIVPESRLEAGPVAGVEAGMRGSSEAWALFVPVDVPRVSANLVRNWTASVLSRESEGLRLSCLRAHGIRQPAFCLLHRDCLPVLSELADQGQGKLGWIFEQISTALGGSALWVPDAEAFISGDLGDRADLEAEFTNVNTPEDLEALEAMDSKGSVERVTDAPGRMQERD